MNQQGKRSQSAGVSLKRVAEYTGLTPGTLSAVLNNAPSARSVPQHTRDRIFAAARALNYRPNYIARALRNKRTYTIAILAPDIGDLSVACVMAGIEQHLMRRDYFFLVASHRNDPAILDYCSDVLSQRGVEGFITLNLHAPQGADLPSVALDVALSSDMGINDWRAYLRSQGENAAELLLARIESQGVDSPQAEAPQQLTA